MHPLSCEGAVENHLFHSTKIVKSF